MTLPRPTGRRWSHRSVWNCSIYAQYKSAGRDEPRRTLDDSRLGQKCKLELAACKTLARTQALPSLWDHLAADVKQSLLALDDETAAACVQALAAAMHAGNLNGDGDAWLRERIAEANAAPAGARSYCSVA